MLKNKCIRCVQSVLILFHSKCFITIEETMMEKLVGANNVKTKAGKANSIKKKTLLLSQIQDIQNYFNEFPFKL